VLIPVWNAAETLGEALQDVAAQTMPAWECILVLDGPTDRSGEIASEYARRDARFRVLVRAHEGLVPTLNAGLAEVRAPVVARFDADDRMHPERLALQLALLAARSDVGVVTCGVAYDLVGAAPERGGAGMDRHVAWLNSLDTPAKLRAARCIDAPVVHPATAFRTERVRSLGGYRNGPFAEDHDLWLRLFAAGVTFARVPETLVTWRDRADRMTRRDGRYAEDGRRRLVHAHLCDGPLAPPRHARIWGAGRYGRRHALALVQRGARIDDLIDVDPKKIGQRMAGGLRVVAAESIGPPDGRLILAAVASAGARTLIAAFLAARGYEEERDWLALQ
jgi:glycosyltransferase involved in cell wall biosynthesis